MSTTYSQLMLGSCVFFFFKILYVSSSTLCFYTYINNNYLANSIEAPNWRFNLAAYFKHHFTAVSPSLTKGSYHILHTWRNLHRHCMPHTLFVEHISSVVRVSLTKKTWCSMCRAITWSKLKNIHAIKKASYHFY